MKSSIPKPRLSLCTAFWLLFALQCGESPLAQLKDYLKDRLGTFDNIEDIVLNTDFGGGLADWQQGEHNYDWKTGTASNCSDAASQSGCEVSEVSFEQMDTSEYPDITAEPAQTYKWYSNNLFSRSLVVNEDGVLAADWDADHNYRTGEGHNSALVLPSYGMRHKDEFAPFEPTPGTNGRDLVVRFSARMITTGVQKTSDKIILALTSDLVADKEGDTASLETVATQEVTGEGIAIVLERTPTLDRWGQDGLGSPDDWAARSISNKLILRVEKLSGIMFGNDNFTSTEARPDGCNIADEANHGLKNTRDGLVQFVEYYGGIYVVPEREDVSDSESPACGNADTVTVLGNPPVVLVQDNTGLYAMYTNQTSGTDLLLNTNGDSELSSLDFLPQNGRFFSPNYHDNAVVERTRVPVEENAACEEDNNAAECWYESNNGYDFAVISSTPSSFEGLHDYELVLQASGLITVRVDGELLENTEVTAAGEGIEAGEMRGFIDNNIPLVDSGVHLRHISLKYHTDMDPATDYIGLGKLSVSLR
jgi:hypothetical protein